MAEFFYRCGPNEYGPLTSAELKRLAQAGRVGASHEIRQGRTGKWVLAESVPGLFPRAAPHHDLVINRDPVGHSEPAINEMDIVAAVPPVNIADRGVESISESDTAVGSAAESHEVPALRHSAHPPHRPHSAVERSHAAVIQRALAVSGLCYAATALGLAAVVAVLLLAEQSLANEAFAGVCFLISVIAFAGGCTIKRLVGLRGGPTRP
jgi:hypothetical protein